MQIVKVTFSSKAELSNFTPLNPSITLQQEKSLHCRFTFRFSADSVVNNLPGKGLEFIFFKSHSKVYASSTFEFFFKLNSIQVESVEFVQNYF